MAVEFSRIARAVIDKTLEVGFFGRPYRGLDFHTLCRVHLAMDFEPCCPPMSLHLFPDTLLLRHDLVVPAGIRLGTNSFGLHRSMFVQRFKNNGVEAANSNVRVINGTLLSDCHLVKII